MHLILDRRLDLVFMNKENTCRQIDYDVPTDHIVKIKEREKIEKCLDLARELKKNPMKYERDVNINCSWALRTDLKKFEKKKDWRNWKSDKNQDYPD